MTTCGGSGRGRPTEWHKRIPARNGDYTPINWKGRSISCVKRTGGQLRTSLWRKYRSYEQRTVAFGGLSIVSSLPYLSIPPLHRIHSSQSCRLHLADIIHSLNPSVDHASRSARAETHPNMDASGSVRNTQSRGTATPEPNISAAYSIAQNGTEREREYREGSLNITTNTNVKSRIEFTDSWMDSTIARGRKSTGWPGLSPRHLPLPGSLPTTMPRSSRLAVTAQCGIWQRSNTIYSQVSKVSPACSSAALKLSSSYYAASIFKAVIRGWATLSIQERSNPILRILRDIDQVFPQLDRTSRVAFMYKSHMVLKVRFGLRCSNVHAY